MLVFCSAHHAEASRGCWWSPTGKSRRQARSLRSSSSAQTGEAALTPCAGRAVWLWDQKGCLSPFPLPSGEVQSGVSKSRSVLHFVLCGSEVCSALSSCCCHHGLAFRCPGEFEIFYWGRIHQGQLLEFGLTLSQQHLLVGFGEGIKGFAGQVFNEEGAWQVEGSACHAMSPLHRSEDSFKQYFSEMPWVAVPYADEARRSRLNRLYGIQGRKGHTEAQISFPPSFC